MKKLVAVMTVGLALNLMSSFINIKIVAPLSYAEDAPPPQPDPQPQPEPEKPDKN